MTEHLLISLCDRLDELERRVKALEQTPIVTHPDGSTKPITDGFEPMPDKNGHLFYGSQCTLCSRPWYVEHESPAPCRNRVDRPQPRPTCP